MVRAADRLAPAILRLRGYQRREVRTTMGPLHVLDAPGWGAAEPLVVLHGLGATAADYAWLAGGLRRHTRRLVLPDLPGHGASPEPAPGLGPGAWWGAIEELLGALGEERFVLLGNSLGGYVAARYAACFPGRVSRLVLVSPGGAPMPAEELAGFWEDFRLADTEAAELFVRRFLARPDWRVPWLAPALRVRFSAPTVARIFQETRPEHLLGPEELSRLTMPVLCIWGRADAVLPAAHREFFQRALPAGTTWWEPEGYGHAPFLDEPADFVARVGQFLAQGTGSSSPAPNRSK